MIFGLQVVAKPGLRLSAPACAQMMPPPEKVENDLGEKRLVHYTGCGLGLGEEVRVHALAPARGRCRRPARLRRRPCLGAHGIDSLGHIAVSRVCATAVAPPWWKNTVPRMRISCLRVSLSLPLRSAQIDISESGPWAQGIELKENEARVKEALAEYVHKKARGGCCWASQAQSGRLSRAQ